MAMDAALLEMMSWVVVYCFASSSMTLLNKAAIKAFTFPYFLCVLQNLATLFFLAIVVAIAPKDHKIFGLRVGSGFNIKMFKQWTPAVLLFTLMLVSSMSAMRTMSVTSVLVIRALTPLVTLLVEMRVLSTPQAHPEPVVPRNPAHAAAPPPPFARAAITTSLKIWLSLLTILGGSVCYVLAEVEGDLVGYVWLGVRRGPKTSPTRAAAAGTVPPSLFLARPRPLESPAAFAGEPDRRGVVSRVRQVHHWRDEPEHDGHGAVQQRHVDPAPRRAWPPPRQVSTATPEPPPPPRPSTPHSAAPPLHATRRVSWSRDTGERLGRGLFCLEGGDGTRRSSDALARRICEADAAERLTPSSSPRVACAVSRTCPRASSTWTVLRGCGWGCRCSWAA